MMVQIIGESFAGVATSATHVIEMYCPEDKRLFDDRLGFALLQKERRTLFTWEGVTQYITPEAMSGTLEFVSDGRRPGTSSSLGRASTPARW